MVETSFKAVFYVLSQIKKWPQISC